jgi:hypothetical protein
MYFMERSRFVCAVILTALLAGIANTGFAQIGQKMKTESSTGIVALWRNNAMGFNMDLDLQANGKGSFDGESISYQFTGNTLVITSGGSKTTYQAKLSGDLLTLSGGDLDAPVAFNRVNGTAGGTTSKVTAGNPSPVGGSNGLIGTWSAQNEEITFTADGKMIYNGTPLSFSQQADQIQVQTPNGNIVFQYTLSGNNLTLKSDGLNAMYTRKSAGAAPPPTGIQTPAAGNAVEGVIDPSLVGKWSYVGTANNISGTFSNEEYVTLKADGTYEYYSETSGTASGTNMYGNQTYAGGMASQSSDRGTWRVKGNTIIANSVKTGIKVYQFEKRNHPKNGDPMIILDGTAYVTYFQKAPWR